MTKKRRVGGTTNLAEDVNPLANRLNVLRKGFATGTAEHRTAKGVVTDLRQLQSDLYSPEKLMEHFQNIDITEDCHLYEMFRRIGEYVCTDEVLEFLAQGDIDVLTETSKKVSSAMEGAGAEQKRFELERKAKEAMGDAMNPPGPVCDDGPSPDELQQEITNLAKEHEMTVREYIVRLEEENKQLTEELDEVNELNRQLVDQVNAEDDGAEDYSFSQVLKKLREAPILVDVLREEVPELVAANSALKERLRSKEPAEAQRTVIGDEWQINVERVLTRLMAYLDFFSNDHSRDSKQWRKLLEMMKELMPDFEKENI